MIRERLPTNRCSGLEMVRLLALIVAATASEKVVLGADEVAAVREKLPREQELLLVDLATTIQMIKIYNPI